MARRSTKPPVAQTAVLEAERDEIDTRRMIESGAERRDAELESLKDLTSAFMAKVESGTLLEKVGQEYFVYDPKKVFHDNGNIKEGCERIGSAIRERLAEKIVFDPRVNAVPIGTGSELTKLAMEDRNWTNAAGNTVVGLGSVNLTEVQKRACAMCLSHPLASNGLKNLSTLTMGEGVTINWKPEDKRKSGEVLKNRWLVWETASKFQQFIRGVDSDTKMLGEMFVVAVGSGTATRFLKIEPDRIKRIFYEPTSGDVRGYELAPAQSGGKPTFLSAADVWHLKFRTIGNVNRGIPRILASMVDMRRWSLFVENRHFINMVRARLPLIFSVDGSNVAIASAKATTGTMPGPGTAMYFPKNVKAEFPSHNIGASDVVEDRKLLESAIAAGMSMPVALVTGDLSANYSSAVLSESPLVRDIEDMRDIIREMIEWMVFRVTGKTSADFGVQFSPVVRRNFADVAAAAVALVQNEIVSRQTACALVGQSWLDIDGERARLIAEQADGFVNETPVDPFNKAEDGGVGRPTTGTAHGGSSATKAKGGDGEG